MNVNKTMLLRNALMVKPDASLEEVRALAPALASIPDGQLSERMDETRRRLGSDARSRCEAQAVGG